VAFRRLVTRAKRELAWGDDERREFAEAFLTAKIEAYEATLLDLMDDYGYQLDADDLDLPDNVVAALADEARRNAGYVVDTHNREMEELVERHADLTVGEIIDAYETWAEQRADTRSEQIAVTEAYNAHADATVAFFGGIEGALFEFGGHPGDEPPECEVCRALVETNPHPLERVIAVGNPHINCRQSWHPLATDEDLPDELVLPQDVAGIVGGEPLVNRTGNDHAAAADTVRNL
jgi:hypothetical protein